MSNHILYHKGVVLALMLPSTLFRVEGDDVCFFGPKQTTVIRSSQSFEEFVGALLGAGSMLLGTKKEIEDTSRLLLTPETSRTTAYLCCRLGNCNSVITASARLAKSGVSIVGCGGIGSLTALLLAGTGVRSFRLIDPDKVELSNLNRQLAWNLGDLGKPKVDVLKAAIQCRFPDARITTNRKRILRSSMLGSLVRASDLAIITADVPVGIGREVAKACEKEGVMTIDGGYCFDQSIIELGSQRTRNKPGGWLRMPNAIAPSYGPVNAELAAIISNLAVELISGSREYRPTTAEWMIGRHQT